jgi:hypothetical protein
MFPQLNRLRRRLTRPLDGGDRGRAHPGALVGVGGPVGARHY